jgi:hypothetical protein
LQDRIAIGGNGIIATIGGSKMKLGRISNEEALSLASEFTARILQQIEAGEQVTLVTDYDAFDRVVARLRKGQLILMYHPTVGQHGDLTIVRVMKKTLNAGGAIVVHVSDGNMTWIEDSFAFVAI